MTDFFASDLHFQHRRILDFGRSVIADTLEEHDEILISNWNKTVTWNDTVYILGDCVFQTVENLKIFNRLAGKKKLVLGNHDHHKDKNLYLQIFDSIDGALEYKKMNWILTHYPIHPMTIEPRYACNVHGHLHNNFVQSEINWIIEDHRYMCVCLWIE